MGPTRREWLFVSLGSPAWAAIVEAWDHAHKAASGTAPPRLDFFDAQAAADIAALASQILPSGDGPGAREAGVVYFIDRALTTFDADKQADYRAGLAEVREARRKMFPASADIATLPQEQQIELVRTIEKTDFFEVLRVHTVLGFLGPPSYGGNRDKSGWKYIGFEERMSWEPPFGYYDGQPE
jgi:gluconate 2-dehydrogenase gamma chain